MELCTELHGPGLLQGAARAGVIGSFHWRGFSCPPACRFHNQHQFSSYTETDFILESFSHSCAFGVNCLQVRTALSDCVQLAFFIQEGDSCTTGIYLHICTRNDLRYSCYSKVVFLTCLEQVTFSPSSSNLNRKKRMEAEHAAVCKHEARSQWEQIIWDYTTYGDLPRESVLLQISYLCHLCIHKPEKWKERNVRVGSKCRWNGLHMLRISWLTAQN